MKSRIHKLISVVAVVAAVMVLPSPASAGESERLVVKLRPGVQSAAKGTGAKVVRQIDDRTSVIEVGAASARQTLGALNERRSVEWAEPVHKVHAVVNPNDPCFRYTCNFGDDQWSARKIGAPQAWDVTTGDPDMKIAVIDSGVDATHPDLAGRVTVGPNFSDEASNADLGGHGTHVAGLIGAIANNDEGLAGINWRSHLVSIKALDKDGSGDTDSIAMAIRWATDNGARIVNMSLGGDDFTNAVDDAVNYAQARGVLIVAAAGNDGSTRKLYPAALDGVIAVGSTQWADNLSSFSRRGAWVDIAAPGEGIVSTWSRDEDPARPYMSENGTSMATPLVSGAASLVLSAQPYMTAEGVAERLRGTAVKITGSGSAVQSGRLNLAASVWQRDKGYRLIGSDGGVFAFEKSFEGSTGGSKLNKPIVAAMAPTEHGYWFVAADGGVFSFGDAQFKGGMGGTKLNKPIVAAAAAASGEGYWMVASDGGVFNFGEAAFFGSTGGMPLNKPIVSILPTASGRGYWLIASDGGVFTFGDAEFHGSTGGMQINKPIVTAIRTPSGKGYWLIASDGGVFGFGDAEFHGSTGAIALNKPIVTALASSTGKGYLLIASDGGVFNFGDAEFEGSTGSIKLNSPIVAAAG